MTSNERDGRSRGILVVDDDTSIRGILEIALRLCERKVVLAASGREALTLFAAQADQIGVALVDWQMPGWDGCRTAEALHGIDPQLPICLMTGSPRPIPAAVQESGHFHTVFTKPLLLPHVSQVLLDLLDRRAQAVAAY